MKGIAESVLGLQCLTNGNLLMTVKRDMYFKPYPRTKLNVTDRYVLNRAMYTGVVPEGLESKKELIEAAKVSNLVKTFECNITYDEFFKSIKEILLKNGFLDQSKDYIKGLNEAELWIAVTYAGKPSDDGTKVIDASLNKLIAQTIPEEHLGFFEPVFCEND